MIYTVTWVPSEKARLATLWNNAIDQQAVADSSDRIDVELRVDPDRKGIPFGDRWVYTDDPLAVLYEIDPGDRKVTVIAVKIVQ